MTTGLPRVRDLSTLVDASSSRAPSVENAMTPRSTSGKRETGDASEELEREIKAHAERGRALARACVKKGKSLVARGRVARGA